MRKLQVGDILKAREDCSVTFKSGALYSVDLTWGEADRPYAQIKELIRGNRNTIWADKLNTIRSSDKPDFDIFI